MNLDITKEEHLLVDKFMQEHSKCWHPYEFISGPCFTYEVTPYSGGVDYSVRCNKCKQTKFINKA